ncbi:MAG: phosphatidate cytidylyltransferase [Oscillospiraceae bacterium]|nr:phosphatidate cytidylyltransferase [Candidatus Equicaccousia limihippi]
MKTRVISGAVLVLVLIVVAVIGCFFPLVYSFAAAVLGALALFEMLVSTGFCKNLPIIIIGCLFIIFSSFSQFINTELYTLVLAAFLFIQAVLGIVFSKSVKISALFGATALSVVVSITVRSVSLLLCQGYGLFYLVYIVCCTCIADTGAYFVGMRFGKHKMVPSISPKKSWEGLIGGLLSGTVGAVLMCVVFDILKNAHIYSLYPNKGLTIGLTPVLVLVGVVGDLFTSLLKRESKIKDFGNIIPGHGGIADRLDSLLFVAPIMYLIDSMVSFAGILK